MKKIIIAETLNEFREVDLNDLYVEALSGVIFSNQYAFDKDERTWNYLSEFKIPDVIKTALQKSPTNFEMPTTCPDGDILEKSLPHNSSSQDELISAISKLIKVEVANLKEEVIDRV